MNNKEFPRTQIDGVSVSRMIIGTNWMLGYSHTSPAADKSILNQNSNAEAVADIYESFLKHGIDTTLGFFHDQPELLKGIKMAEERVGRKVHMIDSPAINVDDTPEARKEAEATIKAAAAKGVEFLWPHHTSVEQLVNKNKQSLTRLPDYLDMIRQHGMIPGLSAHMPELIVYSDLQDYDVASYVQLYNCAGFLMQVEVEYIHKVIWNAKKPVLTIKSMAAGRVSPFVGLNFVWNTIREQDMVAIGCMTPWEVEEDIEISRAALESRPPNLEGRNSPSKTSIMK
jgi:hypothetical protein